MRKIFIDPNLQSDFEKNGYVVVDFISPDLIDEIKKLYDDVTPDDMFVPKKHAYHCTFIDGNIEYKTRINQVFSQYCEPLIKPYLIDFKLFTANFYIKQPGNGDFQVHQNWNIVDEKKHTSLTIWFPLHDTNEHNGTIEVVAGSNKIVDNINTLNFPYFFKDFVPEIKEKYAKPVDLKVGQAIIFDDNIIHYSKTNKSDTTRRAIQLQCVPKEAEMIFYYVDPQNTEVIEMYETNFEFYLTHSIKDVIGRPPLKYLGKIPNENIFLKEEEFVALLAKGTEIRKKFYSEGIAAGE
jgi:hypothetical protein